MVTQAQVGIFKPNPKYAMQVESTTPTPSPIPSSVRAAMQLEFDALLTNNT
jgi:hypothetical protein